MNERALATLMEFAPTVPAAVLKMGAWGEEREDGTFTGCILGHAAHQKIFRGFTLYETSRELPPGVAKTFDIDYKRKYSFEAAALLFGIEHHEAVRLFLYHAPTGEDFAEEVRRFVIDKRREETHD